MISCMPGNRPSSDASLFSGCRVGLCSAHHSLTGCIEREPGIPCWMWAGRTQLAKHATNDRHYTDCEFASGCDSSAACKAYMMAWDLPYRDLSPIRSA